MRRPTDRELDLSVAAMLRFGVTLAAAVVFAGGALLLRQGWWLRPDFTHFQAGGEGLRSLSGIFRGASHLQPLNIIQMGLVILIATPVARVVLCLVGFTRQRSRLYVVISSIVLAILVFSLTKSMR